MQVAKQAIALSAFGGALLAMRAFRKKVPEAIAQSYPTLATRMPEVALTAASLRDVAADAEAYETLLQILETFAVQSDNTSPETQWYINRIATRATTHAESMCCVQVHDSPHTFRKRAAAAQDIVPQLRRQLDDVVHNHLLSRGV